METPGGNSGWSEQGADGASKLRGHLPAVRTQSWGLTPVQRLNEAINRSAVGILTAKASCA